MDIKKLITKLNDVPVPYYVAHAIVALIIAAVFWPLIGLPAGLAAGVGFYAGREFTQWEQGGGEGLPFDWKGIVVPAVVSAAVLLAYLHWFA